MKKKRYQIPFTLTNEMEIDVIMQNTISNVDGDDTDIELGGGGNGEGNIKERDPWSDGIWGEEENEEEKVPQSLW